jgi:hypothetical protein
MKEQLLELEARALKEIDAITDLQALERFRIRYLGKKGQLTSFMKRVGSLAPEERPLMGKLANLVKKDLSAGKGASGFYEGTRGRLHGFDPSGKGAGSWTPSPHHVGRTRGLPDLFENGIQGGERTQCRTGLL